MKPGIYRPKLSFESNFTTIPNNWIRGTGLAVNANFLLIYLLTHEIGYNITFGQIERETGMGETAIRTAMKQLKDAGWLETQRTTDDRGYNAGLAWILTEPQGDNPSLKNPALDSPDLGNVAALEDNVFKNKTLREEYAQELERAFESFWENYPRKVGKGAAKQAWLQAVSVKVRGKWQVRDDWRDPALEINLGAMRLAADPNLPPVQFIPYPSTWLNREGWNDEPYPERVLTADEKKQQELDELAVRREREAVQRAERDAREKAEADAMKRELELNPVPKCEHGRVLYMCRVCSPLS